MECHCCYCIGTGLVGIVAGILGAQVVITDRKMALELTRDNVERNSKNLDTSLDVRELEWGQDVSSFNPPFDYILGADIVYIEETFSHLLKTITELSANKTVILLSCKIRYERDRNFLHLLSGAFDVTQVHYDKTVDIYIYKAVQKNRYEIKMF
jgi:predicted nicotinamide N-methyase